MKTIKNTTTRPLRVPLPRGKMLHLGPRKSGQIADESVEHAALKKLVEAGELEFVEDDAAGPGGIGGQGGGGERSGRGGGGGAMRRSGDR